ncbi:protein of unknown function [Methylococcus capsulatus]|uniref:Uncharacterized protein n=1 Tax=Methylococcus capsulatus TaxID=414 RepID=A0AA35USM6_METCP|nr:protein of unknown function [Methylococcus capsulatus]
MRHLGMDSLRALTSVEIQVTWMYQPCHPWLLDSGTNPPGADLHFPEGRQAGWPAVSPCRNDERCGIHLFTLSDRQHDISQ